MSLRTGHGAGAGVPRIEVLPPDELPAGVPGPARKPGRVAPAAERDVAGRLRPGQGTAELARIGGRAKAERARKLELLEGLGLRECPAALVPYVADAEEFATAEVGRLALTVGGGVCGAAPASLVQSAALQLAGSRAAFAAGDVTTASKLANDSRQNLLAAHELCAREATARPKDARQALADRVAGAANR